MPNDTYTSNHGQTQWKSKLVSFFSIALKKYITINVNVRKAILLAHKIILLSDWGQGRCLKVNQSLDMGIDPFQLLIIFLIEIHTDCVICSRCTFKTKALYTNVEP